MSTPATSTHTVASPTTASGTSAPVLEFLCLFTHDLRRKQKRWQDGRLRYHTFNRRVMAYDDRGNFIGDMHWRADWDLDAGEEIQLERGGVIVQVSDCVGQQSQDLSELVDKRVREREQRIREMAQRRTSTPSSRTALPVPPGSHAAPTRHRPLTAVVGTPTGHHGRALVPSDSPFEQRRKPDDAPNHENAPRPAKRRKYDETPPSKLGYAQSLFGTTLTLSGAPPSTARPPFQPLTAQGAQTASAAPLTPGRSSPELRMPDAAAPTPPCQRAVDGAVRVRVPLHAVDQRRTNSDVNGRKRRTAKGGPAIPSLQHLDAIRTNPAVKRSSRPKSPPKEVLDLTLSDDCGADNGATTSPIAKRRSPLALLGPSRGPCASISTPSTSMDPASPAAQTEARAEISAPMLNRSAETDGSAARHAVQIPAEKAQRTELRLNSRRKRGLLVVSEQASAKPIRKAEVRPLPTERVVSLSPHVEDEAMQRKVTMAPLSPPRPLQANKSSSFTRTGRPDNGRARNSSRGTNNEGPVREEETVPNEQQNLPREEEEESGSDVHVPVGRGRRITKRGEAAGRDGAISDGKITVTPQGQPVAQRRSKRATRQGLVSAPAALAETDTEEDDDDMVETSKVVQTAPRLVKLSRKSVRSKELIGYVFDNASLESGQGRFPAGASDGPRIKGTDHCDHAPSASHAAETQSRNPPKSEDTEAASLPQPSLIASVVRTGPRSEEVRHSAEGMSEDKSTHDKLPEQTRTQHTAALSRPDVVSLPTDAATLSDPKVAASDSPPSPVLTGNECSRTTSAGSGAVLVEAPPEPPKLVNPATRGRKAALKSHAAGQVPQPVLPVDVVVQAPQLVQREHQQVRRGPDAATTVSGLPKIKMTFPGFVSAKGGGPWSREAHDLLETGRPI